jgi:hypothetical protein
MPEGDDVTLNVIFPIDQQLYDAVVEQLGKRSASLDATVWLRHLLHWRESWYWMCSQGSLLCVRWI